VIFVSTEKLPALVKPLGELRGRVRTVVVWGPGDAEAASVRAPASPPDPASVCCSHCVPAARRCESSLPSNRSLQACSSGSAAVSTCVCLRASRPPFQFAHT